MSDELRDERPFAAKPFPPWTKMLSTLIDRARTAPAAPVRLYRAACAAAVLDRLVRDPPPRREPSVSLVDLESGTVVGWLPHRPLNLLARRTPVVCDLHPELPAARRCLGCWLEHVAAMGAVGR